MLVFNGQGDIRDFPGNYTQYRDWKEEKQKAEQAESKKTANAGADKKVRLNEKRKLSFKEKQELTQLEVDIENLENEKKSDRRI